MDGLSAAELADLAGTTVAEVRRLVDLGVLVARDGAGPFLATDAQKVRLATACEQAGLPPAHVGIAAGPVVAQGGDYFGRTVNLAARIAAYAGPGQVLVSERVAEAGPAAGVALAAAGEVLLKGFARPVRLLEASRG
jgi:adenylate cyclase